MIKELLYKWFNLEPLPCPTCEVLKHELETERQFNKVLFDKLTTPASVPETKVESEPLLKPRFMPWKVQRQMLEAEDRRANQVMKERQEQIAKDISGPSGGIKFDPDISELEKEMDLAEKERNHAS